MTHQLDTPPVFDISQIHLITYMKLCFIQKRI